MTWPGGFPAKETMKNAKEIRSIVDDVGFPPFSLIRSVKLVLKLAAAGWGKPE